jgi:hypothetical protein
MATITMTAARKTRVPIVAACALGCMLLQACGIIGSVFVKPGSTVHQISATPDQIVLEYNHTFDTELPAATKMAEQRCSDSGKHATLVDSEQWTIDRTRVAFRCE